ncbi:R3H domain-containing protein 2 [Bienertia sinuspersici]
MESTQTSNGLQEKEVLVNNYASLVDPFLVEALQNPRHRLTILRMELDVQKFLQSPEQQQFEFQHYPTSYLRLAAHRVAQHYGLQTMVLDNLIDGAGTKIMVVKTAETKYPSVCLSEIPARQSENSKHEKVKIAIRQRPRTSSGDANDMDHKRNSVRSVEERKEEYDKARARIFSSPSSPTSEETSSQVSGDGKGLCPSKDDNGGCLNLINDSEKNISVRDAGTSSRVAAIFKDREKDRSDPDYDRSYERYVKGFPIAQRFLPPFSMPKFQPPFVQYDGTYPHMGQIPRAQTALNYGPSDPNMSHYSAMGLNQASRDGPFLSATSQLRLCAQPLTGTV